MNVFSIKSKKSSISVPSKVFLLNIIMKRPICKQCNKHHCAVNYISKKDGKRHYRSKCHGCLSNKEKRKRRRFLWEKSGYKKKKVCDLCGFKSSYPSQMIVFHIDGNLENIKLTNLRSICLNCVEDVRFKEVTWKRGDLIVDY